MGTTDTPSFAVGVIGAGAMGMGVVRSLLRAQFATHVRDIRSATQAQAVALGASGHDSPASLIAACDVAIVLVVDAAQIGDVLALRLNQAVIGELSSAKALNTIAEETQTITVGQVPAPIPVYERYGSQFSVPIFTIEGDLRGCCGTLDPARPLALDVWRNAQATAFRDPRFAPLTRTEWL